MNWKSQSCFIAKATIQRLEMSICLQSLVDRSNTQDDSELHLSHDHEEDLSVHLESCSLSGKIEITQ